MDMVDAFLFKRDSFFSIIDRLVSNILETITICLLLALYSVIIVDQQQLYPGGARCDASPGLCETLYEVRALKVDQSSPRHARDVVGIYEIGINSVQGELILVNLVYFDSILILVNLLIKFPKLL